jgi:hypothetical protein
MPLLPFDHILPSGGDVVADRRDDAHAGHYHTSLAHADVPYVIAWICRWWQPSRADRRHAAGLGRQVSRPPYGVGRFRRQKRKLRQGGAAFGIAT